MILFWNWRLKLNVILLSHIILTTVEYLESRAKRSNDKKFKEVLKKIPNTEPDEIDKI